MHVHVGLNLKELPLNFQNGINRTTGWTKSSSNFHRASAISIQIPYFANMDILLLNPSQTVIANYLASSRTLSWERRNKFLRLASWRGTYHYGASYRAWWEDIYIEQHSATLTSAHLLMRIPFCFLKVSPTSAVSRRRDYQGHASAIAQDACTEV